MTDKYNTSPNEDKQSTGLLNSVKDETAFEPSPTRAEIYKKGLSLLEGKGYRITLVDNPFAGYHDLVKPNLPKAIEGITYPNWFRPLQPIRDWDDLEDLERSFAGHEDQELVSFWKPFYRPSASEGDFGPFCKRMLILEERMKEFEGDEFISYEQSFDPSGRLTGNVNAPNPKLWVPDKSWFSPKLHKVRFKDVFTIFPPAERALLKLILGRIGVGRNGHTPSNWKETVSHTSRMAAVIIGKDPGLGKSYIFEGLIHALKKCGFTNHTFKDLSDKYGVSEPALADIAYKDDTAVENLRKFLASEETKTLITGGRFETEEKYIKKREILPRCSIIVNSNEWDASFAYNLDPGIVDRIKVLCTYRKYELLTKVKKEIGGVSHDSPDLRPSSHLPWLAEKLGVSMDALFLWCLRLATDEFWKVITDDSDPTKNKLEEEVRYYTSRCRIRFKNDVSFALMNAMMQSSALRKGKEYVMRELTIKELTEHLQDFYFVGVDPSGYNIMNEMRKNWEDEGRTSTHYYSGFREIRWETLADAIEEAKEMLINTHLSWNEKTKRIFSRIIMRDGFKIGGSFSHLVEDWNSSRLIQGQAVEEAERLILSDGVSDWERARLRNPDVSVYDEWLNDSRYSPDLAEELRSVALKDIKS